ncbi:FAD-dependent oxidoreductase [Tenacibaculum finnmarkense genomovar finnmarkense]|uniref:NAD(P)/FAD-dependent oxidoreductase n=1 Tax=Tenacibaculum finnmarkense TaxID=2781243 RepID=UPI001E540A48|nr:FAD-dependent oxidoreductase [Tenacibaculum finnmarkense]MCD8416466.1 FAD-dependent oxidoreductase [Tenacibaculum finnmarkense genomovar finnmarkense]MCG8185332.1 FAD-dependent oxidoreductase [Tenacibaculum finnmarkense genomovar finnmarkense]MCG8201401.1 FAD-dependent oxidoreductase [Tenacibaculum finnmarkense genomovar finnmarkense]MCG8209166.1 FAD-dependent oxidoreductase [Tenacibaculum finnmarkense genomovar finnmarkense]MCG8211961.1 FAD-dependent oxidoreductase [Tenacibaculum finnmarke
MSKEVVIIGGGIIGLCSAYYLQKEGHKVTVIDKSDFSSGASYVNAGYITPSHIISLAAPGMINKGIKWMFDSESPFSVKPRLDYDFLKWTWLFKKASTNKKVESSIKTIKDINLLSRELYEDIKASNDFDFFYQHKGLLMCYQTDKAGQEEWKTGERAIQEGLKVENLTKEQALKIEPNAGLNIKGAVYYHSDSHMTPNEFMPQLKRYLEKKGVAILANEEVLDINVLNDKVTSLRTNKQELKADEIVVATGSWSQILVKKLNANIPIQAGKGYRINVAKDTGITVPAILIEAKIAVTPMNGFTRFAGTMEVDKINNKINKVRVNAIAKASENFYKGLKIDQKEIDDIACGLRPCSPDGLPYIGRLSKIKNVTVATGHAMMGWSLGPATGKLVSEVISDKKTSLDLNPFHVERYS